MMMSQSQAPGAPAGAGNAIIHARMDIGDTVLIANDVPPAVFHVKMSFVSRSPNHLLDWFLSSSEQPDDL